MKDVLYSVGETAFSRLRGGSIANEIHRKCQASRCDFNICNSSERVADESIQQSLALAGLEKAVKATQHSTAAIHQATEALEEVRRANLIAAEAEVFAVDIAASLAGSRFFCPEREGNSAADCEDGCCFERSDPWRKQP